MAEIPETAAGFRDWLARHRGEMPPDLLTLAERVRLSLDAMAKARKPEARNALARASRADFEAFTTAWAEHRSRSI